MCPWTIVHYKNIVALIAALQFSAPHKRSFHAAYIAADLINEVSGSLPDIRIGVRYSFRQYAPVIVETSRK